MVSTHLQYLEQACVSNVAEKISDKYACLMTLYDNDVACCEITRHHLPVVYLEKSGCAQDTKSSSKHEACYVLT